MILMPVDNADHPKKYQWRNSKDTEKWSKYNLPMRIFIIGAELASDKESKS